MTARTARSLVVLAFAICVLGPAGHRVVSAAQGPQKTAFVTVDAEKGPLKNLTAKDFIAYEDNSKRDVLDAELSGDPLSIFLIVDTSAPLPGITPPIQDMRTALASFVKTLRLNAANVDIAYCPTSNAAVTAVDFGKLVELDAAFARWTTDQSTTSVILEALNDAGKALKNRPAPRRAVVVVDFNSQEGSAEKAMKPAIQSLHDAGATVWNVSVRGSTNSQMSTASQQSAMITNNSNRESVLDTVAKANGGLRWSVAGFSGLEPALVVVANTLASQYAVTFAHPGGNPKLTHFETTNGAKVLLSPFMR
ncbi:MAG TPA: hypothetical protein VFZ98_11600 [Vicinamibacterales bacterium]